MSGSKIKFTYEGCGWEFRCYTHNDDYVSLMVEMEHNEADVFAWVEMSVDDVIELRNYLHRWLMENAKKTTNGPSK